MLDRGGDTVRFQMRQKMIAIGDDYWIEDADGHRAYRVNGKAARFRDTWVLEDDQGHDVARIRERKLSMRDAIKIETGGKEYVVKKALVGLRERFVIEVDGKNLRARANVLDHEYEIEQDGHKLAEVSKKWFRVRDTYGVEINAGVDPALILSITVAIDGFSHD
jgi:uncharacterized protein YxjI